MTSLTSVILVAVLIGRAAAAPVPESLEPTKSSDSLLEQQNADSSIEDGFPTGDMLSLRDKSSAKMIEELRREIKELKQKLLKSYGEVEGDVDRKDEDVESSESVNRIATTQIKETRQRQSDSNNDLQYRSARDVLDYTDENAALERAVQKHFKFFLSDLYLLFQYDVEKLASEQSKVRHSRQRKPPSRPKRDLNSLRRRINIRKILKKFCLEKGKNENGIPLLRFG